MAEGGNVRVVRCPKCGKLLPELPNFTVYQCGSCGATLQAKMQGSETSQSSPAYSDEMKVRPMRRPDDIIEKKGTVPSSDSLETDVEGLRIEAAEEELLHRISGSLSRSVEDNAIGKNCSSHLEGSQVENGQASKPSEDKSGKESVDETKVHTIFNKIHQTQTMKHDNDRGFALQRALRARAEGISLKAPTPYRDEGPSNYNSKISRVGVSEETQNSSISNGIDSLEEDRVELLRKLDELRDKLRRSGELTHEPRDRRTSHAPHGVHDNHLIREGFSSSLTRTSAHHSPFPYGHNIDAANLPPTNGYGEPLMPRMFGRTHFQHHVQYPRGTLDSYLYRQFDPDPFISYHHDGLYAHKACACVHCSASRPWQMPTQPSNAIHTLRRYHPTKNRSVSCSRGYNQKTSYSSLHFHDSSRRQQKFQQRAVSVKMKGQSCQPIAGAAPFLVCYNCLELLRLPKNLFLPVNSKFKLRCGSCSEVISCELDGKRLVLCSHRPSNSITGTSNNCNVRILDSSSSQNHSSRHQGISNSGEYDSPGYNKPSTDEKQVLPCPFSVSSDEAAFKEYGLDTRGVPSSSSSSENARNPDSMSCQQGIPSSTELPFKTNDTSHVPSVPLHEHLGPPLTNQIADGPGKGSRSRRSDQERILSINGNFKQNSVKDVQMVTEMDVPPEDFPNAGVSQDSCDESKDDDHSRNNKGGESFLAGFLKKSFKDFSRFNSLESGRSKVYINGHPISDRLVKKAEKQAGQIHPGHYWYDYRAGFWGVMGNACLGIIPPFIEEFNYPMPKICSEGNTGVFVNGRELHQRDLDLLANRGLPTASDRSYIIEISGKVWDEDSGEELDCLGKLAPTVEKVKRGFGMRPPRIMT